MVARRGVAGVAGSAQGPGLVQGPSAPAANAHHLHHLHHLHQVPTHPHHHQHHQQAVAPPPSSEDDSTGSWPPPPSHHHSRHVINRQVALNTLATMHRRFSLPSIISTNGRPLAEFRASANKSLDILRQNIQAAVTKEIDQVIKKYLEKFFVPAVNNIRTNLGEESVSEEQLRAVCRAMLDGARNLYAAPPRPTVQARPTASPSELSDSESSNGADSRFGRPGSSPSYGKRKESDTDSDVGVGARRKRRIEKTAAYAHKWDPARLTQDTLFIMGSIANKVLGLGQSRGRLYSKHSGLLRYPADSADKEWIATQNLKTSAGGRTYIMVLEDIEELIVSEDYRHSSTLRLGELSCFRAPPFMLRKIQAYLTRRGELSEDYASSTPTPTPPPVDAPLAVCTSEQEIKEEIIDDRCAFNLSSQIKVEEADVQLLGDIRKTLKTEIACNDPIQYNVNQSNQTNILENVNNANSSISGSFTTVVSSGVSSMDNNYWKTVGGDQISDVSKDTYDSGIKVELNSAADLMDADIEFLSGDFCSYAESEADVKKSFDKLSDGGDIFLTTANPTLLPESQPSSDSHSVTLNQQLTETLIQKSPVVTTIVGSIAVGSLPSDVVHTYVASVTNPSLITLTGNTTLQSTAGCTFSTPQLPTSFSQTLPSFSQISAPLQAQIITQTTPTTVTWQANVGQPTTRTVYSLTTNTSKNPPGTAIVGLTNRATITGNILTNAGSFINLTPKSFSTGNILHNAIVSRNMVNRGLTANRIEITKSVQNPTVTKSSIILPSVSTFSRNPSVSIPPKIDLSDDASITTTKAMIDNTCNSSAMLKQVLTLGSAGVNKTFLTPPTQKITSVKPSTSASSTLSASHATLSALLSGVDPTHSDKKNTFVITKGDK